MTGSRQRLRRITILMMAATVFVACDGGGDLEISDARVSEPTGPNTALYFTASGDEADVLVGANTEFAERVDMHESVHGDDGTTGMQRRDTLELVAGGELVLEPGGLHLMLINPDGFVEGDEITVSLTWQSAGEMTIEVPVVAPQDAVGHDG